MKCPKCNGSGWDDENMIKCLHCHGSGEIEVTNEEWLNTLPTEEKATWLSRHSKFMYECGHQQAIPKIMYEEDWAYWLKQPNKG
jgi:uncharacterized phage protein